jgi:hypothetical protein
MTDWRLPTPSCYQGDIQQSTHQGCRVNLTLLGMTTVLYWPGMCRIQGVQNAYSTTSPMAWWFQAWQIQDRGNLKNLSNWDSFITLKWNSCHGLADDGFPSLPDGTVSSLPGTTVRAFLHFSGGICTFRTSLSDRQSESGEDTVRRYR